MLYQLVGLGLNPLAFTLDNGFISDEAKANIRRVATALGVEHVFGQSPAMNAIFADSLKRYANVCNGCFKTIYSLATQLAREHGIGYIVTGLSRGQFFETRLSEDVFATPDFDADAIDESILAARKAYHRREDVVSRSLDVDLFRDDALFDDVQFVDFYRYCTVSLEELYGFLKANAPWIRPSDTGRSTNCLINDAGIFVHKKLRGFHNYALPYSWDVRLGHKERGAALEELDDDIDETRVRRILREVGFDDPRLSDAPAERLVAYFTADTGMQPSELQAHLLKHLPANAVPSTFVQLKAMPLTPNGKIDRKALPAPDAQPVIADASYAAPRNDTERVLAEIWARALRVERVGIHDNFFALSGDSIIAIQIIARANQAGLKLAPNQLFQRPTIAELADVAMPAITQPIEDDIAGDVPLTPIQHWFFEQTAGDVNHWNHVMQLDIAPDVDVRALREAIHHTLAHHDAFHLRFERTAEGWRQWMHDGTLPDVFTVIDHAAHQDPMAQQHAIGAAIHHLNTSLDISRGPLARAALILRGASTPARLVFVAHHLAVDGVSWWVLLRDLETAFSQVKQDAPIALPAKTTSFKRWTAAMKAYAGDAQSQRAYWRNVITQTATTSKLDADAALRAEANARTLEVTLNAHTTQSLLKAAKPINTMLLAALAQAVADIAGERDQVFMLEGHGREALAGMDVSRTVGWFTSLFPVALHVAPNGDPASALRAAQIAIAALPDGGQGYGAMRYLGEAVEAAALTPAHAPAILFNYLGQMDALFEDNALFKPAAPLALWRDANAIRPHALEVNAHIAGGLLHVTWTHCDEPNHSQLVQNVAERFANHLRHMASRDATDTTLNDKHGVSDAELADVLAEFAE
jgi:non-ribosomal peptide synthase protein (TIGR01720 family)